MQEQSLTFDYNVHKNYEILAAFFHLAKNNMAPDNISINKNAQKYEHTVDFIDVNQMTNPHLYEQQLKATNTKDLIQINNFDDFDGYGEQVLSINKKNINATTLSVDLSHKMTSDRYEKLNIFKFIYEVFSGDNKLHLTKIRQFKALSSNNQTTDVYDLNDEKEATKIWNFLNKYILKLKFHVENMKFYREKITKAFKTTEYVSTIKLNPDVLYRLYSFDKLYKENVYNIEQKRSFNEKMIDIFRNYLQHNMKITMGPVFIGKTYSNHPYPSEIYFGREFSYSFDQFNLDDRLYSVLEFIQPIIEKTGGVQKIKTTIAKKRLMS